MRKFQGGEFSTGQLSKRELSLNLSFDKEFPT